jgi:hypothetical protein
MLLSLMHSMPPFVCCCHAISQTRQGSSKSQHLDQALVTQKSCKRRAQAPQPETVSAPTATSNSAASNSSTVVANPASAISTSTAATSTSTAKTSASKLLVKVKILNLLTYKLHALGDYVHTIWLFGTTDPYSTQTVCFFFLA